MANGIVKPLIYKLKVNCNGVETKLYKLDTVQILLDVHLLSKHLSEDFRQVTNLDEIRGTCCNFFPHSF